MSKSKKSSKKKVIVSNEAKTNNIKDKKTVVSKTITNRNTRKSSQVATEMLFGKENYILVLAGIGLIILGMLLMMGGSMPSSDVWDESLIYSFRRTVLAPFLILAGLIVQFFAIFRTKTSE